MLAAEDHRHPRKTILRPVDEVTDGKPLVGKHAANSDQLGIVGDPRKDLVVHQALQKDARPRSEGRELGDSFCNRIDDGYIVPVCEQRRSDIGQSQWRHRNDGQVIRRLDELRRLD